MADFIKLAQLDQKTQKQDGILYTFYLSMIEYIKE